MSFFLRLTEYIQKHARLFLAGLVVFLLICCWFSLGFKIDASAETLLNKNDKDYALSQRVDQRYRLSPSLAFVFRPTQAVFTTEGLDLIAKLQKDLEAVPGVVKTTSILNAPLFKQSLPSKGSEITVSTQGVDINSAKSELVSSPLYRDLLISKDGTTLGLDVKVDPAYLNEYHIKHTLIKNLRVVVSKYRGYGEAYIGGLEVIADDMISYLNRDLVLFGSLVFVAIMVILTFIFRRMRWVLLAMGCCIAALVSMTGILGLTGWKVTVVSSNFVSLQIIFTMDLVIHLIARYEELLTLYPDESNKQIVKRTIEEKFSPSFYVSFTTVTGFASLLTSGILPVITFGWMMIMGVSISFILTFLIFISVISLLPKISANSTSVRSIPIRTIARKTESHRGLVVAIGAVLLVWGTLGMFKLEVENSFINYFKKSTDLRRGLEFIDHHLGGTTPLTITIDVSHLSDIPQAPVNTEIDQNAPESDDLFNDFEDVLSTSSNNPNVLTQEKVMIARKVHEYLESLPSVGKVTSIWTTVEMSEIINKGPLGNFELAVLKNILPDSLKTQLWDSFYSEQHQQLRISLRLLDSDPNLRRNVFLKKVQYDLEHQLGLSKDHFKLSGAMVLYNNILQQLFDSQILTLGTSLLVLIVVILVWLRNFSLTMIIMVPNLFSVTTVLGFMGWFGIPLDMMTITIASITIGVAVDNAIHYIYHYRSEYLKDGDKVGAMFRTHRSVGHAIAFSSMTICFGFGVLVFSNFIPNIMFGLLTIVAMAIAVISTLTVMPLCLLAFNPIKLPSRDS
jgi:predicted RND superfamily exporter protein